MDVLGIDIQSTGVEGAGGHGARHAEGPALPRRDAPARHNGGSGRRRRRHRPAFRLGRAAGLRLPGRDPGGRVLTTVHLDPAWVGENPERVLGGGPRRLPRARDRRRRRRGAGGGMRWGAGRGQNGVVLMVTLSTSIGTALFTGGQPAAQHRTGAHRDPRLPARRTPRRQRPRAQGPWPGRLGRTRGQLPARDGAAVPGPTSSSSAAA